MEISYSRQEIENVISLTLTASIKPSASIIMASGERVISYGVCVSLGEKAFYSMIISFV